MSYSGPRDFLSYTSRTRVDRWMPETGTRPDLLRFGSFEADLANGALRKHGLRIKLQKQPFQILSALLERPNQPVTREELRQRIWGDGTSVDFEHGLNAAVNKLRQALSDSPEAPLYIETVPGVGYRLLMAVEQREQSPSEPPACRASQAIARQTFYSCGLDCLFPDRVGGQTSALTATTRQPHPIHRRTSQRILELTRRDPPRILQFRRTARASRLWRATTAGLSSGYASSQDSERARLHPITKSAA